jgi:hypothetical protein
MTFEADPNQTCDFCHGDTVPASENARLRADAQALAAFRHAQRNPAPAATCEHGQHWLLCEHCGERNRADVGECLGRGGVQRLADLDTLNEWARKSPARHWRTWPGVAQTDVSLSLGQHEQPKEFYGTTPDAALHAAAEWCREESKTRALLELADKVYKEHGK